MIGKTLGHYRVVEKIGEGGMGEVYRAHDQRLDRDIALKVLPAGTLADESARKRFRKEALTLSKLNHPNIETVHDFDTQDGVNFLVMEHIPGVTLSDKLARGPLPEKEILRLGAQLAEGLAAAHEQGVVHRDLKPGNLRVTPDGRLKILDFGLAKLLRPASATATTESLTETQAVPGTLPYMAPEQLQGEKADARADIYAAGSVLYEMATGRRPFEQKLASALIADIVHTPPTPPSQVNPRVSSRLEDIILKCLEKEPENRYQSAKELLVDLRRLAAPPVMLTPRRGPRGSMWWAVRLAGVGLAAVAVLLAVLVGLNVGALRERLLGRGGPPKIESLAVLPLENLSRDPEQEYFADGMTEELIAKLSKISALKVISRTSVMHFKGTTKTVPEIARELGVDAVIEGSVLREGNQVRISVQLIHGPSDKHLWAESYQRELRGILALQSEVAQAIAREISIKVSPEEAARLASARPVDPEAMDNYLKAMQLLAPGAPPDAPQKALVLLEAAVEREPGFAQAHAGIAVVYVNFASGYFWGPEGNRAMSSAQAKAQAEEAARRALALDPSLGEAHYALALVRASHYDWAGAMEEARKALELNPNLAPAHAGLASWLALLGRYEEGLVEARRSRELNPLGESLGGILLRGKRYEEAVQEGRRVLEAGGPPGMRMTVARAYLLMHRYPEAMADLEQTPAIKTTPGTAAEMRKAFAARGERGLAAWLAEFYQRQTYRPYGPRNIAWFYAMAGDRGRAFMLLERAYEESSGGWTLDDPGWDPIRSDRRFRELLRKYNLPESLARVPETEHIQAGQH